jgi:hypothetical protein
MTPKTNLTRPKSPKISSVRAHLPHRPPQPDRHTVSKQPGSNQRERLGGPYPAVETKDSSVLAQMGWPDMRLPILYTMVGAMTCATQIVWGSNGDLDLS